MPIIPRIMRSIHISICFDSETSTSSLLHQYLNYESDGFSQLISWLDFVLSLSLVRCFRLFFRYKWQFDHARGFIRDVDVICSLSTRYSYNCVRRLIGSIHSGGAGGLLISLPQIPRFIVRFIHTVESSENSVCHNITNLNRVVIQDAQKV